MERLIELCNLYPDVFHDPEGMVAKQMEYHRMTESEAIAHIVAGIEKCAEN